MAKLPSFLKAFFSDLGGARLEPQKHTAFIIERILKIGDTRAIQWMFENFSHQQIALVATQSRVLTRRDVNFWSLILSIPKGKFLWTSPF